MTEPLLIDAQTLSTHQHKNMHVLDATMEKVMSADSHIITEVAYIKGAKLFDFKHDICDADSPYPNTMPSANVFEQKVRALGINRNDTVVVYDKHGIYSAPRAYWMFKAMGHDHIHVLDGGLPEWQRHQLPTCDHLDSSEQQGIFKANYQPAVFCDTDHVLRAIDDPDQCIIDARAHARFNGEIDESRPGLRKGHIPSSINLPISRLLSDGRYLPLELLKTLLAETLPANAKQYIFTCGSGVTACVLALAAEICGYKNLCVYDGSWSEWGSRQELPIA